ncbi:MAG: ABC transporter permease [Bacteroidales bacterium]|nr:ABC transporter permease [Bacteroidales bacterium]
MKQIINNLWSQRAQNVWLLAELVLVCFVAWKQLDPIAVRMYYKSLPKGFDCERLVVAQTSITDIRWFEGDNADRVLDQKTRILKQKLQASDEVEQVCILSQLYGLLAPRNMFSHSVDNEGNLYAYGDDTVHVYENLYLKNEHFFETYGIHAAEGSPSVEELSKLDHGIVISRSLAERLFGSAKAAIGKDITHSFFIEEEWVTSYRICGVVEDVHVSEISFDTWQRYVPTTDNPLRYVHSQLLIRLRPDVNVRRFVEEQNFRLRQFATDGLAIVSFTPYEDLTTSKNQFASPMLSYDFNLAVTTALFFLINLCLGVIGTFGMQTKRRTEESGIMRAFGATRGRIMGMFLAEGFVLTTLSMIITSILYLNYVKTGLGELCINPQLPQCQPDPTWVADKPLHFCILAGIVYVIICIVVSIGIAIPAWNIVRTKVVKALRDE